MHQNGPAVTVARPTQLSWSTMRHAGLLPLTASRQCKCSRRCGLICQTRRGPFSGCYHLMSGNSFIERLHAARHSPLLMCVAASQKPMQSASPLPPPPGLLDADEVPGSRLGAAPPPCSVANWLGRGSDIGDSGATVDPGCAVVGVVVAGTPAGGVSPADGVGDKGVGPAEGDGAAGVVAPEETLGAVRKVAVGAESLGLGAARDAGAPPADERVCANATSGNSSKRAPAARTGGLRVSIAITMALPAVPQPSNDRCCFCGIHNLASDGLSARDVIVVSPHSGRPGPPSAMPIAIDAEPPPLWQRPSRQLT